MTNEAAERLAEITRIAWVGPPDEINKMWRDAFRYERADERHATVERIRAALKNDDLRLVSFSAYVEGGSMRAYLADPVDAILDEEAAR